MGNRNTCARSTHSVSIPHSPHLRIEARSDFALQTPGIEDLLRPIVMSLPLQLLAYHTALHPNRDIDQPRKLAKHVTSE